MFDIIKYALITHFKIQCLLHTLLPNAFEYISTHLVETKTN